MKLVTRIPQENLSAKLGMTMFRFNLLRRLYLQARKDNNLGFVFNLQKGKYVTP